MVRLECRHFRAVPPPKIKTPRVRVRLIVTLTLTPDENSYHIQNALSIIKDVNAISEHVLYTVVPSSVMSEA